MDTLEINNSFQLEFVAYLSMHLEEIQCKTTGSKDYKQRDRYMQLIAMIKEAPFELALENINKSQKLIQIFLTSLMR